MGDLDARHEEILRAIDLIRGRHHACSTGQIAAALRVSKQSVVNRCAELRAAGHVEWSDGIYGSLRRVGTVEYVIPAELGDPELLPRPSAGEIRDRLERAMAQIRAGVEPEVAAEYDEVFSSDLSDEGMDALVADVLEDPAADDWDLSRAELEATLIKVSEEEERQPDAVMVVNPYYEAETFTSAPAPVVEQPRPGVLVINGIEYHVAADVVRNATRDILPPGKKAARAKSNGRRKRDPNAPDTRTPEQIQKAKDRMAHVRAGRARV